MELKVGDLITLTEEGKDFYSLSNNQMGPIFKVTKIYSNTMNIHARILVDHNSYDNFMTRKNFRKATEMEIKIFELKNIFNRSI